MASLTLDGICRGCDFRSTQRGYALSYEIKTAVTATTRMAPPMGAMRPPLQFELMDGFGQQLLDPVYATGVVCVLPYEFYDDAKARLAKASGKTSEVTMNGAVPFNSYFISDVKPGTVITVNASCTWQRIGIDSTLTDMKVKYDPNLTPIPTCPNHNPNRRS